ncbi:MAG TPA: nuclear transport factor 2 family protein [Gemmatimonadaceae bacterium]|nr:nuclear transport factor 2 family protein [Gemmatimonadaceae bacterium]
MHDELEDFAQFMRERVAASDAYVQGDPEPLSHIVARSSPATFFPPVGGYTQGTDEVASRYTRDAAAFERGSSFTFEILQMTSSEGVAYWTGFMRGQARMRGKDEPISMSLRVTEIFRREGSAWKMVHRHADPLAETKRQ